MLPELVTSGYVFASREEAAAVADRAGCARGVGRVRRARRRRVLRARGGRRALQQRRGRGRERRGRRLPQDAPLGSRAADLHARRRRRRRCSRPRSGGSACSSVTTSSSRRCRGRLALARRRPAVRAGQLAVVERPPAGEHPPEQLTAMSAARVNRVFIAVCDRVGHRTRRRVGRRHGGDRRERLDRRRSSADIDLAASARQGLRGVQRRVRRPPPGALRRPHGRSGGPRVRSAVWPRALNSRHRGGGVGEPAVLRAVLGPVSRLWLSVPAAGTPTVTVEDQDTPVPVRSSVIVCGLWQRRARGGALAKFTQGEQSEGTPTDAPTRPRDAVREGPEPTEIDHTRSPTVSVARTLPVSLHAVARASSPVTQPPEPRAIHPTNRSPPSLLAVRTPRHPAPSTAPSDAAPSHRAVTPHH